MRRVAHLLPLAVLAALVGLLLGVLSPDTRDESPATGASGTPPTLNCPAMTICDADAALVHAYNGFPKRRDPHDGVARLMTLRDALTWEGGPLNDPSDPFNDEAVWIVAVRGTGLKLSDYAPLADRLEDPDLDGMWFIYLASGGGLLATGALWPETSPYVGTAIGARTYQSVVDLQHVNLPVYAPTPIPTATSGPTPPNP